MDYSHLAEFIYRTNRRIRKESNNEYSKMKPRLDELGVFILDMFDPLPDEIDLSELTIPEAAFMLYQTVSELDGSPGWETMLLTPELDKEHFDHDGAWRVVWEAGPYNWGVNFSMGGQIPGCNRRFINLRDASFIMEPYYSFDICFSEA